MRLLADSGCGSPHSSIQCLKAPFHNITDTSGSAAKRGTGPVQPATPSHVASSCSLVLAHLCFIILKWTHVLGSSEDQASLVAQTVKNTSAVQETWVRSLGQEDPLEEGMATHSSIRAWRIPWTEEPGGLQPMGHKEPDTTEQVTLSLTERLMKLCGPIL